MKPTTSTAFLDLNADGLVDFARREGLPADQIAAFHHNVGIAPISTPSFVAGAPGHNLPFHLDREKGLEFKRSGSEIVDLNGDGVPDQIWSHQHGNGSVDPGGVGVRINQARPHGLLTTVTNGFGVTATITYAPLTARDTSGNLRLHIPASDPLVATGNQVSRVVGPMMVVEKVSHQDGVGGLYDLAYEYGPMRAHRLHGNLGFEWTSVTDTRTNIVSTTVNSHQTEDLPGGIKTYPYAGMPIASFTKTAGGGPGSVTLSESSTTYDVKWFNSEKTRMVFARTSTSISRDLDGSITAQSTTTTQRGGLGQTDDFDEYGNSKYLKVETGEGYSKETVNTYTNTVDATRWHLGRLTQAEVRSVGPADPAPGLVRKSKFTYHATTGLLETEELEPDHANAAAGTPGRRLWARTTYGYDAFGNKTSVTTAVHDVTARTATTGYDAQGRFPIWTRNALNHQTSVTHHPWWGTAQTATDPNGVTVASEFDAFGRLTKQTTTGVSETPLVSQTFRRWAPGAGGAVPTGALYFVETRATASAPAIEFFDRFGRSIRTLGVDADGRAVAADTFYDLMGRAFRASTPFVLGRQPVGYTETVAFDLLNRPLVVRTPDEEQTTADTVTITRPAGDPGPTSFTIPAGYVGTTFQYDGLVSRVTRPHNLRTKNSTASAAHRITTRTTRNSQGWEVEVVQNETGVVFHAASGEQATVRKTYDALGQLKTATTCVGTAATGVTISHTYDIRGRRTQTIDPDMGTWTYQYNGFGELTSQTDAKGQTITMGYDVLGRLTSRVEGGEFARWYYDTATGKGIGKLHYSERRNASLQLITSDTTAYYPAYSRPISTTRVVDGTSYASSITYDTYGRTTVLTYPTGVKVRQAYNTFGVVKEVRRQIGGAAAASDPVIWMALPDTTTGDGLAESRYLHGNGVVTARVASRATGRVRSIETGVRGAASLQAIDLDYDRAGNVLRRIDEAINLTDTAWYDALNRLTGFTSAQGYVLNDVDVHYSALGNITWKSDVGSYTYGGPRPHAVTSITSTSTQNLIYDANGNMTSGLGRTIAYTAYNQISGISQSGASSTFTFSAERDRIKQVITGRGTVVYGSALYERFTPTSGLVEHTHYIMTPAGRTASYKTWTGSAVTETRYFHTDHLGSITLVTGEKGGVVQRFRYDPWGKRLGATADPTAWMTLSHTNNGGFRRGFTDHEHLEDLGLIHMNGRIFDPVLARFLSADPNIDGVSDSQGYNRYSYVLNNPMNATDPTGYLSVKQRAFGLSVFGPGFFINPRAHLKYGGQIAGAVVGTIVGYFSGNPAFGGMVGGAISGFTSSMLNGSTVGDAFRSALVGGVTGAVLGGASAQIGQIFKGYGHYGIVGEIGRASAHGLVGGGVARVQGGKFSHGFMGSAAGSLLGHAQDTSDRSIQAIASRTVVAAAIGGTVSVIGGGKFANAAITSAFQHLFNSESSGELEELELVKFAPVRRIAIVENVEWTDSIGNGDVIRNAGDIIVHYSVTEYAYFDRRGNAVLGGTLIDIDRIDLPSNQWRTASGLEGILNSQEVPLIIKPQLMRKTGICATVSSGKHRIQIDSIKNRDVSRPAGGVPFYVRQSKVAFSVRSWGGIDAHVGIPFVKAADLGHFHQTGGVVAQGEFILTGWRLGE